MIKRIISQIEELQKDPFPQEVKRVEGFKERLFRVGVGNHRILYEVDNDNKLIGIVKIDKRERVY